MDDIWIALLPIYKISKIFGLVTYSVKGTATKREYRTTKKLKIYCFIFMIIMSVASILKILYEVKKKTDDEKKMALNIFLSLNTLLHFLLSYQHLVNEEKIIVCTKILEYVDKNMTKLDIYPNYQKEKRKSSFLIAFHFFVIIIYYLAGWLLNIYPNKTDYIYLFIKKSMLVCTLVEFETFLILIRNRFKMLRKKLLNKNQTSIIFRRSLVIVAKMHRELCVVVKILNSFFNGIMLFSIILITTYFIMVFDSMCDALVKEGLSSRFLSLFASLPTHWIFLVIVIHNCNEVSKDVSLLTFCIYVVNLLQKGRIMSNFCRQMILGIFYTNLM